MLLFLSYCAPQSFLKTKNISQFDTVLPKLFRWKHLLKDTLNNGKYSYTKKISADRTQDSSIDFDEVKVSFSDLVVELMENKKEHIDLNNKIYSDPKVQVFNNEGRLNEQTEDLFKNKIQSNELINMIDNKYFAVKFIDLNIEYYKNGELVKVITKNEKYLGVFNFFEGESKTSVSFAYFLLSSLHSIGLGTILITLMETIIKFIKNSAIDRLKINDQIDNTFKHILTIYSELESIEAVVNENNLPSLGVLKKCGFKVVLSGIIRGMSADKLVKQIN